MKALAALRPQKMNGTEEKYAWVLELQKRAGGILDYGFNEITLRLGDDCRYTPDFWVLPLSGIFELHEVKGFFRDDAKVKIKVAAAKYPFIFRLVRLEKGQWNISEIEP